MAQQNRRQVSIRTEDWERAARLRDKVSHASGRKVTITDTISRALGCLEGELEGDPRYRDRVVQDVEGEHLKIDFVSVLSQFIARTMPDRRLRHVTLEPGMVPGDVSTMVVHLDDREIPLFTGRVMMGNPVRSHEPGVPTLEDFLPDGNRQMTITVDDGRAIGEWHHNRGLPFIGSDQSVRSVKE